MLRDDFADLEAPREKGKPRPFKLKVFFITLLIAGAALSPSAYLYFKAGGSLNPLGLYQFVFESGNEIKRTKQWMQKGEWHKARDIIRYYYTMEADNANYLALGALINYKMGRYQEAMDLAQALVELDPERAEGHALVGASAIHFTRFAEARAASQKALQLDSYLALPYITMGNLYLKGGQADRALTLLKQAGRLNPQDAETWTLLSSVYLKQDDLENAMLAAQTALEIEPDSPGGPATRFLPGPAIHHHGQPVFEGRPGGPGSDSPQASGTPQPARRRNLDAVEFGLFETGRFGKRHAGGPNRPRDRARFARRAFQSGPGVF